MSTKEALENRKKEVTTEKKDPELLKPTENIVETPKGADGLPALTNEQIHNLAKNLYATMKVVELHQHMHNEHYGTEKEHAGTLKTHEGHHELSHNVIAKMIDLQKQ